MARAQATQAPDVSTSTERQSDQAFEQIKRSIILCRLAPGTSFSEAELSAMLGLGRAATRAALTRLGDTGLIQPIPRHGYVVTRITMASVRELFDLRLILEPAAAALATGKVDIARLRAINSAPQQAVNEGEQLAFIDSNRAFHRAIVAATGNRRLFALLEDVGDEMQRLVHLGLFGGASKDIERRAADRQHEDLIAALASGHPEAAREAARRHVEHARGLAIEALMNADWPVPIG